MDKQYLQSFTDEQLKHYLNTLKRRVKDLKELTLQLGKTNEELEDHYQELVKTKTGMFHEKQKKKKSWNKWLYKGKEQISKLLHLNKQPELSSDTAQEYPQAHSQHESHEHPQNEPQEAYQPQNQLQEAQNHQNGYTELSGQPPQKKTISPIKKGLQYLNKGKQKLSEFFRPIKTSYNPNEDNNYEINYQLPEKNLELYNQMAKEFEPKKQMQFGTRLQGQLYGHQNIPPHHPPQPPKVQDKPVQQSSAGSRSQNATQQIERTSLAVNIQLVPEAEKEKLQEKKSLAAVEGQTLGQDSDDNQYALKYETTMKDYQLPSETVEQIIEKPLLSQEQMEASQKDAKEQPTNTGQKAKPQQKNDEQDRDSI